MAEAGLRSMPEFAWPVLKEMIAIAKKMPAPQAGSGNRCNRICKVSHNRVGKSARLHTIIKKPFVTRQSSGTASYLLPALTKYSSGMRTTPAFSTHLLQSHAECQQLIDGLCVKQERMHYQLEYLHLEAVFAVNRGKELTIQLQYVNTMIQCNQEIMDQFPANKRKLEHRNARLYCKKLQLEDRLEHFDATAMVLREYTINVMVKQLNLLDNLLDAVAVKQAELMSKTFPAEKIFLENGMQTIEAFRGAILQQRA
jgi:hypothetical protein